MQSIDVWYMNIYGYIPWIQDIFMFALTNMKCKTELEVILEYKNNSFLYKQKIPK